LINWTRADFLPKIQINKQIRVRTLSDSMNPHPYPLRSIIYHTEDVRAYNVYSANVYSFVQFIVLPGDATMEPETCRS